MNYYAVDRSGYISHHGILGMKWGVRRYQNPDGSLTPEGQRRYNAKNSAIEYSRKMQKDAAALAKHYRDGTTLKAFDKMYGDGTTRKGQDNFIEDFYSNTGGKKLVVSDEVRRELPRIIQEARKKLIDEERGHAEAYEQVVKRIEKNIQTIENTPIEEISNSDLRRLEHYVEELQEEYEDLEL